MATSHLEKMFSTGKLFNIKIPDADDIELWIERPNVIQMRDVVKKSRASKARRKQELLNRKSDERLTIDLEIDDMNKKALVEFLSARVRQEKLQQATNDVMFDSSVGSDWGVEGEEYLAIVDAVIVRLEEIEDHNKSLSEADVKGGRISAIEDEELGRLSAEQERFSGEVTKRHDELMERIMVEVALKSVSELSKEVKDVRIELECDMAWFEEYRVLQLYYACRYPDDHKKLYFSVPTALTELPAHIRGQVFEAFDEIDVSSADAKNYLTSLSS